MNIFKILSRGDGTIQEPNITSVLSYLLDPYADHGMGALFLKNFLKIIKPEDNDRLSKSFIIIDNDPFNHNSNLDVNVEVEKRVFNSENNKSYRDLDILLEILKHNEIILRLIIEIKIYKLSYRIPEEGKKQLKDIFEFTRDMEFSDKNVYLLIGPDDLLTDSKCKATFSEKFKLMTWKKNLEKKSTANGECLITSKTLPKLTNGIDILIV